jgi:hypothetical protein
LLSGTDLAGIDSKIRDANARIQDILTSAHSAAGAPKRLQFLDVYTLFDLDDYKNSLDDQRQIAFADLEVDNRYLAGKVPLELPPRVVLKAGGFQSIDGMHPSGCGYAVVASEAMKPLGLPQQRDSLLKRGYEEDTLLSQYPLPLDVLTQLLRQLRALRRFDATVHLSEAVRSDPQHLLALLPRLQSIFIP